MKLFKNQDNRSYSFPLHLHHMCNSNYLLAMEIILLPHNIPYTYAYLRNFASTRFQDFLGKQRYIGNAGNVRLKIRIVFQTRK